MAEKIIKSETLNDILSPIKKNGKKIVFTNGSFDILHAGHIAYLKEAKKLGDVLFVGVNSDESIKKYKSKKRPINILQDRITVLSALETVDYVVPFNETTPSYLIELIEPDIFVKGGDYTVDQLPESHAVKLCGGKIKILPFRKGYSTTAIIQKILQIYGK